MHDLALPKPVGPPVNAAWRRCAGDLSLEQPRQRRPKSPSTELEDVSATDAGCR